jgi:hypothetical protein
MIEGSEISARELSGEIWAEVTHEQMNMQTGRFDALDHDAWMAVVDIMTGVIARHTGKTLVADAEHPAEPLPDRIGATFGKQ